MNNNDLNDVVALAQLDAAHADRRAAHRTDIGLVRVQLPL